MDSGFKVLEKTRNSEDYDLGSVNRDSLEVLNMLF